MDGRTPVLKKSRWLLLKRKENLKTDQLFRLRDLLRYNLKIVRAYIVRRLSSSSGITTPSLGDALPHRADEEARPFPAPTS
jgi:hypothetical protein